MEFSNVTATVGLIERIIALFSKARRLYNKAMTTIDRNEKKKLLEIAQKEKPSKRLARLIEESLSAIIEAEKAENTILP